MAEAASFFDYFYSKPGLYYGKSVRPEFQALIKNIDCSDYQALDLGCGEGRYSVYLSNHTKNVYAIDYSTAGIHKLQALAKQNHLNITTKCADVNKMSFDNEQYDLIVMATLLDNLNVTEQRDLLAKVFYSLKKGGMVYADVFTTADPGYRNRVFRTNNSDSISETSSAIKHYFHPGELKDLFFAFDILAYKKFVEKDISHGPIHTHGLAYIIAKKTPVLLS